MRRGTRLALCSVLGALALTLHVTPALAQAAMMSEPFRQGYSYGGGLDWTGRPGFAYFEAQGCSRSADSPQRAIEACTRITQSNVERRYIAGAFMTRGDIYDTQDLPELAQADYQRAIELYDAEIADAPETSSGYVGRAAAYYRLDMFDMAIDDLDRAISLDGGNANAYYSRAITHFRLGDYAAAISDYDRTAQLGRRMATRGSMRTGAPTAEVNPAINAGRCIARAAAGVELDVAQAACRDATRRSGNTFARGFLNFMQSDYQQAWSDFAAAVDDDETDGHALYGRGVAAVRLGRQAEGEADIARAREIEGEDLVYYANAGLRP
jgi:tetratricopeptide (TPR) repeat protein